VTAWSRSGIAGGWILACSAAFLFSLPAKAGVLEFALQAQSSNSTEPALKKDYALIYGTVWGPDDHPAAGVPIIIRRASGKKAKWELVSDRNGEFAQRVPVGTQDYIVQADIKTPKGQPKPEVTVHIDDNERKDIGIHLSR
jgi:hypothetical protein